MASKKAKTAAESKPKSNRGGTRPGAGAKPKAVKELRAALIAEPDSNAPPLAPGIKGSAADAAMRLLIETMNDAEKPLELRIKCADRVLDRFIGKPRPAEAPAASDPGSGEQVHIYMPDNGRTSAAG